MGIIILLLVGLIAGALAGRVTKGSGFGILGDIVVGLVGALIGGWVLSLFGLSTEGNVLYDILVAFVGAVILVWLVSLIMGGRSPLRHNKETTPI